MLRSKGCQPYFLPGATFTLTIKAFAFSPKYDPTKKLGHHRSKTLGYPAHARNIAGPGHNPAIPQPSPKMASPMMSWNEGVHL